MLLSQHTCEAEKRPRSERRAPRDEDEPDRALAHLSNQELDELDHGRRKPLRFLRNLIQSLTIACAESDVSAFGGKCQRSGPAYSFTGCSNDGNAIAKAGLHRKSV